MMAYLLLADGTIFKGHSIGAEKHTVGEVVFNTSHLGYQEILTDPSYLGQIINFTSPHIGNVGINQGNFESDIVHARGAIFRSGSNFVSHWQAKGNLHNFLKQHEVSALSDIDTRALTLYLREHGSQTGCIVTSTLPIEKAMELIKEQEVNQSISSITTQTPYVYASPVHCKAHLIVVDCGVKAGILQSLKAYPVKITVVPATITFNEIQALQPDGVLLSNGPGDPRHCISLIQLTKTLLQEKTPLFGICLGHQILALAAGGVIKKMKFGHHGANHPIQCMKTGSVFISSQNHSYVVDESLLPGCFNVTHISLFDRTIAGLEHKEYPAFSFQGHPEANPGPQELKFLFKKFIQKVHYA
jgi:carbamoyl-phosphate synthase small subunit